MLEHLGCAVGGSQAGSTLLARARLGAALVALLLLLGALASCGGSSKSNAKTTPQGSSNWDELVWDQDAWS